MPPPLEIVLPVRVQRVEKASSDSSGAASHGAGFDAGYQEGRLRAEWEAARQREKEKATAQQLVRNLETLHQEFESLLAEHMPELIRGALNRVFRQHPFTIEEIAAEVSALLRDMAQAARISLECSAAEAEPLLRQLENADAVPDDAKLTMQVNPALQPGEFLLKSDLGDVDGRHASRVRQIHLALEAAS